MNRETWLPGGYSTQKWRIPNLAFLNNLSNDFGDGDIDIQPFFSHYRRNLSWVEQELFDLYPSGQVRSNGRIYRVTPDAKDFIRRLYGGKIDPDGGWWNPSLSLNKPYYGYPY